MQGFLVMLLFFLEELLMTNSKVLLPDANVTCIFHEDCILPCSFTPTSTVVIHWYKQQIPVHSYYYNKDQFGLQNKHFSGRTCLFNSHIPHGNASLLLRRVKVQDRGLYKCYTSTRKGSQEMFVNLEVKALIQSVIMEMTDEVVTCSSHNIYPVPYVTWATDPPSAQEVLENSTTKTTDHKGLYTVESVLRILGNLSNHTYFCSFISADQTQVWTASRKNQETITEEEGSALSIPCIAPHSMQNFSLTWTFSSSLEPIVIVKYDNRTRHTFNLWEGQAELDPELLLQGDGSLLIPRPDIEQHSGTYTCTFSGLQSRHIVQNKVNITVASVGEHEQNTRRSWWSTAASAAFVLFTIIVALPQCARQKDTATETRTTSHRYNGTRHVECELHKDPNSAASFMIEQHSTESIGQSLQHDVQDEVLLDAPQTADDCGLSLSVDTLTEEPRELPEEEGGGVQPSGTERDPLGNMEPRLCLQ